MNIRQLVLKIKLKYWLGKLKVRRKNTKWPINEKEYRVFSQHREDGIIDYLLDEINHDIGSFVEFGFAPQQCNCLNLAMNRGFSGLFMDGSSDQCQKAHEAYAWLGLDNIQIRNVFIDRDKVDDLIREAGIEGEIDVLSIDVDGNDYWFWETIESVDPRIVVIEYNATFGAELTVSTPYDAKFVRYEKHDSGFYHGCSLAAIEYLGKLKGYRLVAVDETGVNAFLVKDELCPNVPTLSAAECFVDNRGRTKYKNLSRAEQFARIQDMPLVDVTEHSG